MHGRLKVRTSEEQAEAKRKEQQEKLKIYQSVTSKIFAKRSAGENDEEILELTGRLLEKNPDFYTLWNYRREVLLLLKAEKSDEELKKLCLIELDLTQNCLRVNPKSYAAWNHRFWVNEFNPEADWKRELKLCNYFQSQDERNFHCWDYRRLVREKCNVTLKEELDYSTELINTNFSNYSAWHYRSTLLPVIYKDMEKGGLKEDILMEEFDWIQNAAFTDPNDQSVWFYHRWLLGRKKSELQILNVSVLKDQKLVIVLLSEPIKDADKYLELEVNEVNVPVLWESIESNYASTVWKCLLPDSQIETFQCGDGRNKVSIHLKNGKENCDLHCEVNGSKSFTWWNTSRSDAFRSDFSAATKDVLEKELESCQQLNELEPNCKWTIFTCVLLMRALNNAKFQKEIEDLMHQLVDVDPLRKNYYKDLGSKFVVEDLIENLPIAALEVNLSNRHLTSLYYFDHLILIEKIDLSSNNLTSVQALKNLLCVKEINLDDNQLSDLEGLEKLGNLKILSVRRNLITKTSSFEMLKSCKEFEKLNVEGNPLSEDIQSITQKISTLKSIDGSPL